MKELLSTGDHPRSGKARRLVLGTGLNNNGKNMLGGAHGTMMVAEADPSSKWIRL